MLPLSILSFIGRAGRLVDNIAVRFAATAALRFLFLKYTLLYGE